MAFKSWLFTTLASILVLGLLLGCVAGKSTPIPVEPPPVTTTPHSIAPVPPIPVDEVSLEEAVDIVGVPIAPKYLPAGWEFQRGFVWYLGSPPYADLNLYFSDQEITEKVETLQDYDSLTYKLVLNVNQVRKMPSPYIHEGMAAQHGGEVVDINGIKGWLSSGGHDLHWYTQGLHFVMYIPTDLPAGEILEIARSIK